MKTEALLTLLALVVAVVAILPPERRLDIRIRFGWMHWLVIVVVVIATHLITYTPVLFALGFSSLGDWKWGLQPDTASYAVLLLGGVFIWATAAHSPMAPRKIHLFGRQVEILLGENRYGELSFLLKRHFDVVNRLAMGELSVQKLRSKLVPEKSFDAALALYESMGRRVDKESPNVVQRHASNFLERLRVFIASFVPTRDGEREFASGILRRLLLDRKFVEHIARSDLDLALQIVKKVNSASEIFESIWLEALLLDSSSAIYFELTELTGFHGPRFTIPGHCRVLRFYLHDARMAEKRAIYKPAGELALRLLEGRRGLGMTDQYNQDLRGSDGRDRQLDTLSAVLLFFDVMIREAAFQGIAWHMWLYYMPIIVEGILLNMRTGDPKKQRLFKGEAQYNKFLQDIVFNLCGWIKLAESMAEDSPHYSPVALDLRHENGNIPKSAVVALNKAWRLIVASESVSEEFKVEMLESILRAAIELNGTNALKSYRHLVLLAVVKSEGILDQAEVVAHQERACRVLQQTDHVLRFEVDDELKRLMGFPESYG